MGQKMIQAWETCHGIIIAAQSHISKFVEFVNMYKIEQYHVLYLLLKSGVENVLKTSNSKVDQRLLVGAFLFSRKIHTTLYVYNLSGF